MRETTSQNPILQVFDTHIVLPSGRNLALDSLKSFMPSREFWQLWRASKLAVKRAGVFVKREGDEWRGYVREGTDAGFSYTQSDLHVYWTEKAKERANQHRCDPVIVGSGALPFSKSQPPCHCRQSYEVVAKVCKNGTFQLRLKCGTCLSKTLGAIAWNDLGSELVIGAIAHALQNPTSLADLRSGAFSFV